MMKNKILVLASFLIIGLSSNAQVATTVVEAKDNIEKTNGTVLKTKINRASEKTIIKEWKSKMKDYDGDVDTKKNRIMAEEVKIEAIGTVGLEIIAEVRKVNNTEHEFVVMFMKNGQAISSDTELSAFAAAKNIVRNFANTVSKEATEEYQKDQLKLFGGLENDMEDAKKEEEKAKEDIEDAKKDIEKAKEDIEKAKEEISKAEEEIKEKGKFLEKNAKTQTELSGKVAAQRTVVNGANAEVELFK